MGKLLANQIRGINPLAKKGVLLLWAFLLPFACVLGSHEANAAPTASNAWTNVYAATAAAAAVNLTSTTAFTANAGSNRLLLVAVNLETAAATTINLDATPTFGGVALTPIKDTFAISSRMHTWMGFLPDGLIPTGAQTVNFQASVVAATTITGAQIKIGTYTGVDQSTPVSASVANYAAAITVPFPAGGLAYTADSRVVVASTNSTTAITPTYTSTGGGTIAIIAGGTSGTGGFSGNIGVSAINASAGTYTTAAGVTYTGGGTRSSLVAVALKAWVASTDVTKPSVTSFVAPSSATSTTITGITMTATDDTGVTGYGITESATPPLPSLLISATPLTSYTASSAGTHTLYAWAKDAAGNVSNLFTSQTVTIVLPPKPTRAANWTSQYGAVAYPAGTVSNYSMTAGSNRLLVVAIAATSTAVGAQSVTNVTWGGKPLTLAAGNGTLNTIWNHSYIYYLKEADIASASGTALTATITGGTAYYTRIYAAVYTGVDQTNPVSSSALYESATLTTAVGPFSPTLNVGAQEQAVEIINLARNTAGTTGRTITTWATGWTTAGQAPTGIVTSGPCQQVYIRDRAVPTSAVADTSQHTSSSANIFKSMAAISIKAASSGLTVTTGSTIPAKNVYAGDTSVAVDAFSVSAAAADTITSITVTGSATTTSANVSAVRVYRKVGVDSTIYQAEDLLVASGTFTGNTATMTPSGNNTFTAGSATNFIVVYDIASGAAPDVTLTGNITAMTATAISSLVDPLTESATLTIHATTTIGNGVSEPAYVRLYKNSVVMLDAFTLKHNGTGANDDTISNVTVTLAPAGVSGSGPTLSKIGKLEVVNEAGTVVYGTLTAATTGDTWNISTPALVATNAETNYYLRITTAASIVPGYYSVSGTITSVVHSKPLNKLVNNDTSSTTHNIDTELPVGPTTLSATTPPDAALIDGGGGKINLSWDAASDPNAGTLHATLPYIVKRSAAGGVDPDPYCTSDTTAFEGNALGFNDSGLNDTSGPIYHYRVCARDAQGNISIGVAAAASPSYTNYCDMAPALTLGEEDPLNPGTIQDQLVKSEGGNPFLLQVINNDIGTCPNVTFNIALVETSTIGGSGTPPPSVADFSTTFPASVLLGKTAGPGGTNKTSETVSIYIHGLATADQIQKFKFKAQVSAAGHGSATSPFATAILNDMPPIVHNANNMGKYQYGVWGNEYTCATCHSNSTTNIKGVFEVITTQIGKRNVVFNTISGNALTTGGYSNDLRANKDGSNNICSVCHHRTRQHQYSASKLFGGPANDAPYTTDHHNNRDCVKCHTHNTAFRSILGVCGDCHGFKGTDYSPVSKTTMVKVQTNALGTNPPSYGAHMAHNYAEMSCAVCHNSTNHGLATDVWLGDDKIEMGFNVTNATFPGFNPATPVVGGTFEGTTNLNFPYTWLAGPGTSIITVPDYNASCNTYCHGGWTGNSGSNTKPNWVGTGQAACGTCHNATLVTPPLSGSHPTHAGTGATGLGKDCKICHGTYTQAQYTGAKHINGNVEWNLSAISAVAQYNGSNAGSTGALATDNTANYQTCTNMYCHSNVQGVGGVGAPTAYAAPLWGDNGAESGTVYCGSCHQYPNEVGGHKQHTSADVGVDFDCHVCHYNGGRTSPLNHANQKIDFQFSGLGENTVYSKGSTVTPGLGYGTCGTSDCHGRYTRTWAPASAITFCDKCHGSATSARGFYNTRGPDGTLSIYSAAIGMHDIHLQNPNSPRKATFSRFTSYAAGMSCKQCHYNPQGPFSPGHVDNALPAEVPFAHISSIAHNGETFGYYSTPTYSFATQSCSNVWCHGAGMQSNTAKGKYAGKTPYQPLTPKWNEPMLSSGNSCTKCHAMPPAASSSADTHWSVSANRVFILSECVGCHQSLNNNATGFSNKSLHINGRIDGGCTGCHGDPPITTGIGNADGLARPAQNALVLGTAGAHDKHTKNASILKNCYTCHDNYNPVMIDDGTGKLEIGFNAFNGKSKGGTFTGYTSSVNGPKWLKSNAETTITKVNNTIGQEANVCSNIYCHGSTITSGTLKTPNWELADQAICGTCHGGDNLNVPFPAQTGAHSRHASVNVSGGKVGLGIACETCHGASAANMAHVNGEVTWGLDQANPKIGTTALYKASNAGTTGALAPSGSYGTCSNFYCHSNVQGAGGIGAPTVYQTMTWGAATALTCSSCHLSQVGTGTASHAAHTALYGGSVSCGYCHHDAGANTEEHANGMIYVNVTTSRVGVGVYTGSNRVAGAAGGYGSCSNIICHGAATLTWGADLGTKQCQKCHGSKSAAFLTVTSAQVAPGYGADGIATDGTTAATARRVGAHQRHLTTGVLSTNVKCSECHVKVNTVLDNGHLNYTTATLTFSGRATGNGHTTAATSRSAGFTIQCSNLWCHTGKANSGSTPVPVWTTTGMINETTLSVASCNVCHGFPPKSVGAGGTALGYDHTSLADPTAFPVTTCTSCHTNMSQTGTTYDTIFTLKSQHLNGSIEAIMNCDSCHDYDVNGATWGGVKNANYAGNNQGIGAHYKHIVYLKAKYSVTLASNDTWASTGFIRVCGTCHSITAGTDHSTGTPTNPRSITFGDNATNPRNFGGTPLYNGNSGTSSAVNPKTCSNTDCHYRTSPVWSTY